MEIIDQQINGAVVRLTSDEVVALANALNESLEHLEDWEFDTRMGAGKAEVRELLKAFGRIRTA